MIRDAPITPAFAPEGLAAVKLPIQLWRGSQDDIVPDATNTALLRQLLPAPPDERVVDNGGHFSFLPPCSAALAGVAPEICVDPPGFDRIAFHRTFNAAVITYFAARLGSP